MSELPLAHLRQRDQAALMGRYKNDPHGQFSALLRFLMNLESSNISVGPSDAAIRPTPDPLVMVGDGRVPTKARMRDALFNNSWVADEAYALRALIVSVLLAGNPAGVDILVNPGGRCKPYKVQVRLGRLDFVATIVDCDPAELDSWIAERGIMFRLYGQREALTQLRGLHPASVHGEWERYPTKFQTRLANGSLLHADHLTIVTTEFSGENTRRHRSIRGMAAFLPPFVESVHLDSVIVDIHTGCRPAGAKDEFDITTGRFTLANGNDIVARADAQLTKALLDQLPSRMRNDTLFVFRHPEIDFNTLGDVAQPADIPHLMRRWVGEVVTRKPQSLYKPQPAAARQRLTVIKGGKLTANRPARNTHLQLVAA